MKPQAVHLRIGRLVVDAGIGASLDVGTLANSVQAELSARAGDAQHHPSTPIARAIADGVSGRLHAMNVDAGFKNPDGGRNGPL